MMSIFSKAIDYQVDRQFRKDPNGRLVFLPFGPKKKAYFVDSKSDEEKIRALVKMYRSASARVSWLVSPSIYIPSFILNVYGSGTPLRSKLTASIGISSLVLLIFLAMIWMLWSAYKEAVPGFTSSLTEVGPDLKGHLSEISSPPQGPRRLAVACLVAGLVLLAAAVLGATHYSRSKCPPLVTSTSQ
jgi:hypothetical protein